MRQVYRCGHISSCPGGLPAQCNSGLIGVPCGECPEGGQPDDGLGTGPNRDPSSGCICLIHSALERTLGDKFFSLQFSRLSNFIFLDTHNMWICVTRFVQISEIPVTVQALRERPEPFNDHSIVIVMSQTSWCFLYLITFNHVAALGHPSLNSVLGWN